MVPNSETSYKTQVIKMNDSTYLVKWDTPAVAPKSYKVSFNHQGGQKVLFQSNTLNSILLQNYKFVKDVVVGPANSIATPIIAEVDIDIVSMDAALNLNPILASSDVLSGNSGLASGSAINQFLDTYEDDCTQLGSIKYKLNYLVANSINYTEPGNSIEVNSSEDINQDNKIDQESNIKNAIQVLPAFNGVRKNHIIRRLKCN